MHPFCEIYRGNRGVVESQRERSITGFQRAVNQNQRDSSKAASALQKKRRSLKNGA